MKLLLNDAVQFFNNKGDTAITRHFIYGACRAGKLRHYRAGNRYVIDTNDVEAFLEREKDLNIKDEVIPFSGLRKISV
jgi:excisionase family DNA binding protein